MSSESTLLARAPVRRYVTATLCSALGFQVILTVMFWQVFERTGNALDIAWVGLAQFVPSVLLVLFSGWFADRFDRRYVTAVSLLGRALCSLAAVAYSIAGAQSVLPLVAIAAGFGVADAVLQPARRAMTPLIVGPSELPRLVAVWTATFTGSAIVGPLFGGLLITLGPAWGYGVGAALHLVAIVPVLGIRFIREPTRLTDRPTLQAALAGLTFIRSTPLVLAAISLDLLAVLFGGSIALIKPVADQFGVGDIGYGFLRSAPGIGAAAMALWLAWRPLKRHVGPLLLVAVAIFGFSTVVFGATTSFAVAFVALVVSAAADMVSMVIRGSMVPLATPDDQLGRVSAVEGVFIGASNELGAFESGVTARMFGVTPAIVFGGAMTILVAGTFTVLFPSVRRLDTFADITPPGEPSEDGSAAAAR